MNKILAKTYAFFQKANGYIALAVFAVLLVYGLGMGTAASNCQYYDATYTFYAGVQKYNDIVVYCAIAGLAVSALYKVFRNNLRKVYYPSNFVWSFLYVAVALSVSALVIYCVRQYQIRYEQIDFAAANAYWVDHQATHYLDPNSPVFGLGYAAAGLIIVSAGLVLWISLGKLIGQKKAAAAANVAGKEGGIQ